MLECVPLDHPDVRDLPLARAGFRPPVDSAAGRLWCQAGDGMLRFARCGHCGRFEHPPRLRCPRCGGRSFELSPVGGTGTVDSFTVNSHPWEPGLTVPYVIAVVALAEGIRLTTNLIRARRPSLGLEVRAVLVDADPLWIPVFAPDPPAPPGA